MLHKQFYGILYKTEHLFFKERKATYKTFSWLHNPHELPLPLSCFPLTVKYHDCLYLVSPIPHLPLPLIPIKFLPILFYKTCSFFTAKSNDELSVPWWPKPSTTHPSLLITTKNSGQNIKSIYHRLWKVSKVGRWWREVNTWRSDLLNGEFPHFFFSHVVLIPHLPPKFSLLMFLPLDSPLPLSVGMTCDSFLTNRIQQGWWDVHNYVQSIVPGT